MDVAEPLDVDQNLAGAGAGGGTGRCKSVADQRDARLPIAFGDEEVDRPDLNEARAP